MCALNVEQVAQHGESMRIGRAATPEVAKNRGKNKEGRGKEYFEEECEKKDSEKKLNLLGCGPQTKERTKREK